VKYLQNKRISNKPVAQVSATYHNNIRDKEEDITINHEYEDIKLKLK
jgi:hypothetical protein